MGSDPRIAAAFLDAGLGYGGYCFPKDVAAFERLAERVGYPFPLLAEVARINDEAVDEVLGRIREAVWNLPGKRICVLGLAYKPGTDDVRSSPALALAGRLIDEGAEVTGYDPRAGANAKAELPALRIAADPYDGAQGAHAVVLATEWDEFRDLTWRACARRSRVGLLRRPQCARRRGAGGGGFRVHSIGRPSPVQSLSVPTAVDGGAGFPARICASACWRR
jgi:UDPglucose 6-dehydrogenase